MFSTILPEMTILSGGQAVMERRQQTKVEELKKVEDGNNIIYPLVPSYNRSDIPQKESLGKY